MNLMLRNFDECLVIGDVGEAWTKEYYKLVAGEDLYKADTEAYRSIDVDFVNDEYCAAFDNVDDILNSNVIKIEVKTDSYKSGNQCIEVLANSNKNSLGWSLYTEADYIVSVFTSLDKVYIYDGKKLKEFATRIQHDNRFKYVRTKTKGTYSDGVLYESAVRLVPRKVLYEEGIIKAVVRMSDFEETSPLEEFGVMYS